jgi:hypothetical protein
MDHSDFTERQLTTKLVYDGKMLKVREDTVRLPDGKTARCVIRAASRAR